GRHHRCQYPQRHPQLPAAAGLARRRPPYPAIAWATTRSALSAPGTAAQNEKTGNMPVFSFLATTYKSISAFDKQLVDVVRQWIDNDLLPLVLSLYGVAADNPMRYPLIATQTLTRPVVNYAVLRFHPKMGRSHLTVQLYLPHHHAVWD